MITSSHIIYGWATAKASESTPNKARTLAFVIGSFLPDIPVYIFFFVNTFILGTSQRLMWDVLYFDSAWTPFFTLSHSLLLWPLLLSFAIILKKRFIQYVASAALLHITLDFLVHNDDAYKHFWPLTDWKFMSPISYWDQSHYGQIVGAVDSVVILGLLAWLYTKYNSRKAKIGIPVIMALYVASLVLPYFIF